MSDVLYWSLVNILDFFYWGGELFLESELPRNEPAIFIANHIGPVGPIAIICSVPLRLYPWIIADMVDPTLAADYLRKEFIEKSLHLQPPYSTTASRGLAYITVPMLRQLGCIPVYSDYVRLQMTLQVSLDLLLNRHHILVFPEDPALPVDPVFHMTHFRKGVTRLGEMYYQQTGSQLAFFPISVHQSRQVRIGRPIYFSPQKSLAAERLRIRNYIEESVHQLYLESAVKL